MGAAMARQHPPAEQAAMGPWQDLQVYWQYEADSNGDVTQDFYWAWNHEETGGYYVYANDPLQLVHPWYCHEANAGEGQNQEESQSDEDEMQGVLTGNGCILGFCSQ